MERETRFEYLTKIGIDIRLEGEGYRPLCVETINDSQPLKEIEGNTHITHPDLNEVTYVVKTINELGITIIVSKEDSIALGEEEVFFIPQHNILTITY